MRGILYLLITQQPSKQALFNLYKMNIKVVLFFLFSSCNTLNKKEHKRSDKVIITYVDQSIETVIDVTCQSFETTFKGLKKTIILGNPDLQFKQIDSQFSYFEPHEKNHIDVRAKIVLQKNGSSKIICMDSFGSFYDDDLKKYLKNRKLKEIIFKIIEFEP